MLELSPPFTHLYLVPQIVQVGSLAGEFSQGEVQVVQVVLVCPQLAEVGLYLSPRSLVLALQLRPVGRPALVSLPGVSDPLSEGLDLLSEESLHLLHLDLHGCFFCQMAWQAGLHIQRLGQNSRLFYERDEFVVAALQIPANIGQKYQ